jgi:hypothetical protein
MAVDVSESLILSSFCVSHGQWLEPLLTARRWVDVSTTLNKIIQFLYRREYITTDVDPVITAA